MFANYESYFDLNLNFKTLNITVTYLKYKKSKFQHLCPSMYEQFKCNILKKTMLYVRGFFNRLLNLSYSCNKFINISILNLDSYLNQIDKKN